MRPINLNDALVLDRRSPQTLVRQLHGLLRETWEMFAEARNEP